MEMRELLHCAHVITDIVPEYLISENNVYVDYDEDGIVYIRLNKELDDAISKLPDYALENLRKNIDKKLEYWNHRAIDSELQYYLQVTVREAIRSFKF